MQKIAKTLDMTVTETFRHLQRLTDANLIGKKVDGTYTITPLGKLATIFLLDFNFILKNSDYFLDHDLFCIPQEFIERLGELSSAEFCHEAMSGFNRVRNMVFNAEKFLWTMAEQVDSSHIKPTQEKVSRGLDFKFIMQAGLARTFVNAKDTAVLSGSRYLQKIPVTLVITENEASITFRTISGAMDYMGLHGSDEKLCKWAKDLFLYYWEKAQKWYPGINVE